MKLSLTALSSPGWSAVAFQRRSKNAAAIAASSSRTPRGTLDESTSPGTASAQSRHSESGLGAGNFYGHQDSVSWSARVLSWKMP